MDPALVHRLSSGEGWGLLQSLPPYDGGQALTLNQRLRSAGFDADLVAAALTQSRLRARARHKFGDVAARMLFTADGLEQSTRAELSERHATRFARAGVRRVWDLGCGIGADAMALSGCGLDVTAVDADPVAVEVARVNLRPWPRAEVALGRVEHVQLPARGTATHRGAWLDPARRLPGNRDAAGRAVRLFRLDQLSPSWQAVQDVADRLPAVGAKLAPAFPHARVPAGVEAQWVSFGGEVLECVLWWGDLVSSPGRSALVHTGGGWTTVTGPAARPPTLSGTDDVGPWLYEPDKAVLQAGLVSVLTQAVDGAELDSGVGYVTASRPRDLTWARRFQVLQALPLNTKALRGWARDLGVGRLTIKKRGVSIDPDRLRRDLRLRGEEEATVVLTRVAGRPVALHVAQSPQPLPNG